MNTNHLLLMLSDGAKVAYEQGDYTTQAVLDAMVKSLVESSRAENDNHGFGSPWRNDDIRAIYDAHR